MKADRRVAAAAFNGQSGEMKSMAAPRHVLVTGASSGIGAALARHYAESGVTLSLLARNVERMEGVAAQCRNSGAEVISERVDVCDGRAMSLAVESCDARLAIDLVIANAGLGGERALAGAAGESLSDAHDMIETNVTGVANTVIPLLPHFLARRRGQIAIISSLAAFVPLADSPVYAASKAAVRVYGHGLRRLLLPGGVAVTVVCPGFVATPMSESLGRRRPFLWSTERAARYIADGLARNRREISFPWQLAIPARLAGNLPFWLSDPLFHRTRRNGGMP